jgi:hypothetical protein
MHTMSPRVPARGLVGACALSGALLGACATADSRAAAYERALAQWQGASEELLLARWGKPQSREELGASSHWLTYVVDTGGAAPTVAWSIGGFGFGGGNTAVGVGVGATAPLAKASARTCTTRFLLEGGKVSTWTFDGPGCGAPG